MQIPIDARGVTVEAGFKTLLSGVSFRAWPGEVLALLGPSGAGKSTLFRALNGSAAPDGGEVLYGGDNLYKSYDRFRMQIGYVPQDDILHDALTPFDVLWYTGKLRLPAHTGDEEIRRRVDEVLGLVELSERSSVRVRRLSGGQRKRVNLGVELMTQPPVLFLDEPTSGLDPALEEKMMELFRRLARGGRTVLVTTHVTESLDMVDRVLVLCSGQVVFHGRPRTALEFFGVESFSDIYGKLASGGAPHWAGVFKSSAAARMAGEPPLAGAAPAVSAISPGNAGVAQAASAQPARHQTAAELLAQLERELEGDKRQ